MDFSMVGMARRARGVPGQTGSCCDRGNVFGVPRGGARRHPSTRADREDRMSEISAHHGLFKDTNLHVDDHGGSGRPVVLIHGWPLSGESWKGQVPAFQEAGFRVVTYDRRGFGRSDKPLTGYDYDALADDLHTLLAELELTDVTLVGFSMGGGEVARHASRHGSERVRDVVFASSVTPYLLQTGDNPDGPLDMATAARLTAGLTKDQDSFYDGFITDFFSVGDEL
jgi:pimeloyl-ACP methyl ester carboxylesterase